MNRHVAIWRARVLPRVTHFSSERWPALAWLRVSYHEAMNALLVARNAAQFDMLAHHWRHYVDTYNKAIDVIAFECGFPFFGQRNAWDHTAAGMLPGQSKFVRLDGEIVRRAPNE